MSEQDLRRVAAEASLDVRTVRRIMMGQRARSSVTHTAVVRACAELGFDPPPRSDPQPTEGKSDETER